MRAVQPLNTNSPARRESREVLQRFFVLSMADQLRVFTEIRSYLGGRLGQEDAVERTITRRADALEALKTVAGDLRSRSLLSPGQAPTAQSFDKSARRLELEFEPGVLWSRARVVRAFGSWRNGQAALMGQRLPEGSEQLRLRRDVGVRQRRSLEPISALRKWLATQPASRARFDYDQFAKARNSGEDSGQRLPLARAIVVELALDWTACLRAAEGGEGLNEVRADRRRQLLNSLGDDELIGSVTIAALLDQSVYATRILLNRETFPVAVATIGRMRAWLAGDVKLYLNEGLLPARARGELQEEVLGSAELAKRLSIDRGYLQTMLTSHQWARVPRPAGKVGPSHYWWRRDVDAWADHA